MGQIITCEMMYVYIASDNFATGWLRLALPVCLRTCIHDFDILSACKLAGPLVFGCFMEDYTPLCMAPQQTTNTDAPLSPCAACALHSWLVSLTKLLKVDEWGDC